MIIKSSCTLTARRPDFQSGCPSSTLGRSKSCCRFCKRELKKIDLKQHINVCKSLHDETRKKILSLYLDDYKTLREISGLIKISKNKICEFLSGVTRNYSESMINVHKLYPEKRFNVSEKTRDKIRKKRIEYLKTHKFDNAWRRSKNNQSYPEKIFENLINQNKLFKKYDIVEEYSTFPYYLDFAFLNIKLDVEIDGSQHWRNKKQKDNDIKRDKLLMNLGWKIYRIPEFKLKYEFEQTKKQFLEFIENIDLQPKFYAFTDSIIKYEEIKKQKEQQLNLKRQNKKLKKQQEIDDKIEVLKNSKIDFSKFGWVGQVSNLINIRTQKIKNWMKKNMLDFYNEKCFKVNRLVSGSRL